MLNKIDVNYHFEQVRDSQGGILAKKENMNNKAKATFVSEIFDQYEICIVSRVPTGNFLYTFFTEDKLINLLMRAFRIPWTTTRILT